MTFQLIKPGHVALARAGRGQCASGSVATRLPPVVPPTVPSAPTGISFAGRPISTAVSNYNWGVGTARAVGGVGPFVWSLPDNAGIYQINRSTGQVSVQYGKAPTVGTDSITIAVIGSFGVAVSQTFSFPVTSGMIIVFSDDTIRDNAAPSAQNIAARAYGLPSTPVLTLADPTGTFKMGPYNYIVTTSGSLPSLGSYPVNVTAQAGGVSVTTALAIQVVHEQPAAVIFFAPRTVSTSTPTGSFVGVATAADADNLYRWNLSGDAGGKYHINSVTGEVFTANPLGAGIDVITILMADLGTTYSQSFSINAYQGTVLPATNMTMTLSTTLTNFVADASIARTVGVPVVIGMAGTPAWSLVQDNVCPNDAVPLTGPNGKYAHGHNRYLIDPATGSVTAKAQLSAQVDTLTLSCTDGINTCTAAFNVVVSAVVGPTLYVGQGMAAAHGATLTNGVQGFEHWAQAYALFQAPNSTYAGATVIVAPNNDPNYYANDIGNALDPRNPTDYGLRFGLHGPVTIMGAPGGVRPRFGGVVGAPLGGVDMGSKGCIVISDGDVTIQHMEFSDIHANYYAEGTNPVSNSTGCAVRQNGNIWGNLKIVDCYIHDCDQGIETGDVPGTVTVTDTEIVGCGGVYVSSGATHNMYFGGNWKVVLTNVLSWKCNNGHTLKCRAMNGVYTDSRFYDTERGSASKQADLCDGGLHSFTNCVFQKGTMAQNPFSVGFCAEMNHGYPQNVLTMTGCTFINNTPAEFNPAAIALFTIQSPTSGTFSSVVSTNNKFIGFTGGSGKNTALVLDYSVGPNKTGQTSGSTIAETGSVQLSAQPALSFAPPGTGGARARPGPFYFLFDGEGGSSHWAHIYGVQIDPGSDDIHVPHASPLGTVVATCTAYGCSWFKGAPSQPDSRVQPFVAGTVWSMSQAATDYLGFAYTVAPAGRYTMNASTGILTVAQALTAGVDNIVVRATAPNGTVCEHMFYVVKD